jgi:hypothetical protein
MENLQEPKTDLSKNFTFKEKTNNSNEKEPENKVSVILDPLPENVLFYLNSRMII